uniref:Uncharacterized protein n=1 Tax=Trichogramma kaykai TaxID=54128 RepID=A0ABD2VVN8_9HYME
MFFFRIFSLVKDPRLHRNFYPTSLQCLLPLEDKTSTLAFSKQVKRMAIKFHRSLRSYLKYKATRHSRGTRSTHATRLLPPLNNPQLLHTPIHTYRRLQSNLPIEILVWHDYTVRLLSYARVRSPLRELQLGAASKKLNVLLSWYNRSGALQRL